MNQNHPSPEDRGQLAGSDAGPQQLAEIEQQLKRARPRPPELDVAAIMRAAHPIEPSVVLPRQSVEQRDARSNGWIAMIAVSWACGAIAGGLVTFLLLSQSAQPETPTGEATAQNERLPKVTEPAK